MRILSKSGIGGSLTIFLREHGEGQHGGHHATRTQSKVFFVYLQARPNLCLPPKPICHLLHNHFDLPGLTSAPTHLWKAVCPLWRIIRQISSFASACPFQFCPGRVSFFSLRSFNVDGSLNATVSVAKRWVALRLRNIVTFVCASEVLRSDSPGQGHARQWKNELPDFFR